MLLYPKPAGADNHNHHVRTREDVIFANACPRQECRDRSHGLYGK